MNKYLRYIAAFGSAFLVSLAGVVWNMLAPSTTIAILLGVLALVPVLLLAGNLIAAKVYMDGINRAKVADMQSKMLRQRQLAQEASGALLFKLQSIRRATVIYAVFVWLLGACAALFAGMMYSVSTGIFYPCLFYAGLVFARCG